MALHYQRGFAERFAAAAAQAEEIFTGIEAHPRLAVERVSGGTNVAKLEVKTADLAGFRDRLANRGILPAIASDPALKKGVNIYQHQITYPSVAQAFGLEHTDLDSML